MNLENFCNENFNDPKNVFKMLMEYKKILLNENHKMNLIGKSTMSSIWKRHILDSAQIEKFLPKENEKNVTIDVGTGAGFPGIVLAALGRKDLLLCEKSVKKNIFLNVVDKECNFKFYQP